jgi:hypothetical protein
MLVLDEIDTEEFYFRGGPLDGRWVRIPVSENREWTILTVDGVWFRDREEPLPADPDRVDVRTEVYLRVDDGYVHESLVTLEDDPPNWMRWKHGLD